MNPTTIMQMLAELAVLPFFPAGNESALIALTRLVGQMCRTEDEVRWLVDRMTSGVYSVWPGPQEMRAVFCSRYKPRDGINAYSSVFPDGLPPSSGGAALMIGMPDMKALPPGATVSVDVRIEAGVQIGAALHEAMHPMGGPATPAEIATAPSWLRSLCGLE